MVPEAPLRETEHGLVPDGDGWFVVNAREARWLHSDERGSRCDLEGDTEFPQLGINVTVILPGQPSTMYHGENAQEDFLVVAGECIAILEGEERRLEPWDFVHCPPWTEHSFVGAGDGPCVLVAVGARRQPEEIRYTVDDVALRHGAGVEQETTSPKEAYARFAPRQPGRYRDGDLPDG